MCNGQNWKDVINQLVHGATVDVRRYPVSTGSLRSTLLLGLTCILHRVSNCGDVHNLKQEASFLGSIGAALSHPSTGSSDSTYMPLAVLAIVSTRVMPVATTGSLRLSLAAAVIHVVLAVGSILVVMPPLQVQVR
jgi:hypothetical protein